MSRAKKDRLSQQHVQEQEFGAEPNGEEIDWEQLDWEEIEKEASAHPELSPEARKRIRREASSSRMLRFLSEGKSEEFKKEWEGSPDKDELDKRLNVLAEREFHLAAWRQILDSTGQGKKRGAAFRISMHYKQLNPRDGINSAHARLIVAMTETTMTCLHRASLLDASPARELELNYATKSALTLIALTRAFDSHREQIYNPKKTKRS